MRRSTIATMLVATALATAAPIVPRPALAQTAPTQSAPTQSAPNPSVPTVTLNFDPAQLPPLPPIIPAARRDQTVLIATGAGAAIGVIIADLVTGGMLLAPLGVPNVLSLGGAAVGAAAPTYSIAQRLFAGVASIAAAISGGYIGGYFARAHPDLVGLQP